MRMPNATTPRLTSPSSGLDGRRLYHHLGVLEVANLVFKERDTYTLTPKEQRFY
jgi:hypothetical protein